METVIRAVSIYIMVWVVFRIAGKRTLSESTSFDFVLLLIIAETTQDALLASDSSLTNAALLIITLVGIDVVLSLVKMRSARVDRWMDGQPVVLVREGQMLHDLMWRSRVDRSDILEAARRLHGLERMDQIRHAVLERSGGITIIPWSG